jgi:hypothetical protein
MAGAIEARGSGSAKRVADELYRFWAGVVPAKSDPKARLQQHLKLLAFCRRAARGDTAMDLDEIF